MAGTLFVVATPIGNLEDISARALRVLREVAIIAAEDTRRTARLLARYAIPTRTTSLHEHNESRKAPLLIDRLERGESIALVSDAGTPAISDPGLRLIRAALDRSIRVEPIPGPNAAIAALAVSGLPGDTFTFMGFPPIRAKDRISWFSRLRSIGGTIVFFEAPHRIRRTLKELGEIAGDRPVVVARELTKVHEELVRGPISAVLQHPFPETGEFTVVADIGQLIEYGGTERVPPALQGADVLAEFGHLTTDGRLSRRTALGILAKRHGLSPNEAYALIEKAKKSVE
jgi:16S rRNA (cytidine1402-2'-O)-methyltransferase